MNGRRLTRAMVLGTSVALLTTSVAFADTVSNSIDNTVDNAAESIALTAGGATGSTLLYVSNTNAGHATFPDPNNPCNLAGAATLTISVASSNTAAATAQLVSPTDDATAKTIFNDCADRNADGSFPIGADLIKVLVTPLAAGSTTITISQVSTTATGTFYFGPATFEVTVQPPPNTAPTPPGAPSLSAGTNPNNTGQFTLGWTASTDDGNPNPPAAITYQLFHRDANDAGYTSVASGITSNTYTFASGNPESEGTWTYKVQASDSSLVSGLSDASTGIVVDMSAPNAPSLTADRAPDYAGGGGWYQSTVTISSADNGDPSLADGSAGSGVDPTTVGPGTTFSTSGSHTATDTVFDFATNESLLASLTVQVDATVPSIDFAGCPATVTLNSSASRSWSASDAHSGLATAASGSETLDTSSIGSKSVSVTATDNVGLQNSATCYYDVVFDFAGFFRPIDNLPTLNSVRAGQAVPVKFSLAGDQGLGILAAGFPTSKVSTCDAAAPVDVVEETITAGGSSLSYDATTDQYVYVWKTDKGWAGTCRTLSVKLVDGTVHQALFKLTK